MTKPNQPTACPHCAAAERGRLEAEAEALRLALALQDYWAAFAGAQRALQAAARLINKGSGRTALASINRAHRLITKQLYDRAQDLEPAKVNGGLGNAD